MASRRKKRRKEAGSRNSRIIRAMGAFVVICLVFAGGFLLRGSDSFLERMGMGSLSVDVEQNPGATVSGDTFDSLSARIAEVQGMMEQDSLDDFSLDEATRSLVVDFLKETGDPYARYYDAESYAAYTESQSEDTFGIGVLFGDYENQAYAVDVLAGSSAQVAGVESGDFILAIDGERRDGGWPLADALKLIEREEGSSVTVTWRRPDNIKASGGEEFTTTLVCGKASGENVTSSLRDGEVGYVKVRQLGSGSSALVSTAVRELAAQGARAYVLDLRDCPGGYLTEAVELASLFQGGGVVVQIQTAEGVTSRSASGSAITDAPLAVVVDGDTAAAAEVVAASLQDNDRAVVVGQSTMGKGTVQVMRELSFGGAVSYTAAEYLTPQGRSLDQTGVSPNVVAGTVSSDASDVPLDLAVEAVEARLAD